MPGRYGGTVSEIEACDRSGDGEQFKIPFLPSHLQGPRSKQQRFDNLRCRVWCCGSPPRAAVGQSPGICPPVPALAHGRDGGFIQGPL